MSPLKHKICSIFELSKGKYYNHIGTGFFIGYENYILLVTAKHNLDAVSNKNEIEICFVGNNNSDNEQDIYIQYSIKQDSFHILEEFDLAFVRITDEDFLTKIKFFKIGEENCESKSNFNVFGMRSNENKNKKMDNLQLSCINVPAERTKINTKSHTHIQNTIFVNINTKHFFQDEIECDLEKIHKLGELAGLSGSPCYYYDDRTKKYNSLGVFIGASDSNYQPRNSYKKTPFLTFVVSPILEIIHYIENIENDGKQ